MLPVSFDREAGLSENAPNNQRGVLCCPVVFFVRDGCSGNSWSQSAWVSIFYKSKRARRTKVGAPCSFWTKKTNWSRIEVKSPLLTHRGRRRQTRTPIIFKRKEILLQVWHFSHLVAENCWIFFIFCFDSLLCQELIRLHQLLGGSDNNTVAIFNGSQSNAPNTRDPIIYNHGQKS